MKLRDGFVSNSSSSSFILAIPNDQKGKLKVTVELDLTEILDDPIRTVKALKEMVALEYGWDDKDTQGAEFKKYEAELSAGKTLWHLRVSNEDGEPLSDLIYRDPSVLEGIEGVTVYEG